MFSYLYSALLLLLFSLIIRGVSLEFRGKIENDDWKKTWDIGIFIGSALPALLLGVAFGNIFSGFPMDAAGYHGSLLSLLNPYGLLTGALFVLMFLTHGSLYVSVKTEGELSDRSTTLAGKMWFAELAVAALLGIKLFLAKGSPLMAFSSSCVTIVMVVFTGVIGLFPNLIPSSTDTAYSLTIFNSSSSTYTLKIMTIVALVFVPIVIAYKIWVYRIFRSRVTDDVLKKEAAY
jgi:cytochrome d ubiquinol oxidase subunit II